MSLARYHTTRFTFDPRRDRLWQTLCDAYFSRLIRPDFCVLELGAGYGHFINHVRSARRLAVDRWEGFLPFLAPGVEGHVGNADDLDFVPDASVDFAFASNLFEHLTREELSATLAALKRKLRPGGTLNLLQPNYRFAFREYFDDYTHVSIFSDRSLCDFLAAEGFRVIEVRPRFLPLTIKSRFPVIPFLIRLYLKLPPSPFAKQMLVRAEWRPAGEP
ncbi:MAG: class I SAM-dependent methyltransferase [Thermoanaerobaculia bacterium]